MKKIILLLISLVLSACGFKPQGERQLAPPLQRLYLQTPDTYGILERNLKDSLKMSHVQLVSSPNEAKSLLIVTSDTSSQDLLSVSGTQQTRQYNLRVNISFEITTPDGKVLLPPQALSDVRSITVQSNQILGSSNEAALYYQQMRRSLVNAIMNRIASIEVTDAVNKAYSSSKRKTQ